MYHSWIQQGSNSLFLIQVLHGEKLSTNQAVVMFFFFYSISQENLWIHKSTLNEHWVQQLETRIAHLYNLLKYATHGLVIGYISHCQNLIEYSRTFLFDEFKSIKLIMVNSCTMNTWCLMTRSYCLYKIAFEETLFKVFCCL